MYYERIIEPVLRKINDTFPVLILTGPRQTGKTTLLTKMASEDRKIVSLDNPTIRAAAREDPELFLQSFSPPVLIDEIQFAPELLEYIKIYADREKRCGDFWLAGSQTFHLMKGMSESLAGRAGVVRMQGLSLDEIRGTHFQPFRVDIPDLSERMQKVTPMTLPEIFQYIFRGSLPRLYENEAVDREQYYESWLETFLSRDLRDLVRVADETAFLKFIRAAAAGTAAEVNYEVLAGEAGISAPTAKRWLSVLVSSGIVTLIQPFANNALKRIIKAPRMYITDTGLCAYLTGWSSPETLENGAMSGALFETWVVSEICKSYLNQGIRPPVYFYRDSNRKEIDLILVQDGTVTPLEIKKNAAPKDTVKNFSVLAPVERDGGGSDPGGSKAEIGSGGVICMSADLLPADRKNWLIPAWLI